jgi:tRNA(Ile)-lysidine synthase
MITLQGKLERKIYVAFSGGVDSVAAVDFLKRSHEVVLVFFHHGNDYAEIEYDFVKKYAIENSLELICGFNNDVQKKGQSLEEFWRNARYKFFFSLNVQIITCHHLDDCVETWVWSSSHGDGKVIPYYNRTVYRPFRLTQKEDFLYWAEKNGLKWIEDESNKNEKFTRNYIRHTLLPAIRVVNPGISKVIAKKIRADKFNDQI